MLWPSINRWKFQRSRIGKLMASAWCLKMVCSPTTTIEASMMPVSQPSWLPKSCSRVSRVLADSQSTTRPSVANRKTSYMDTSADSTAMPSR